MANFGLNGFGFPYSYNQQSTTTTNYFYGASSGTLTEPTFTELIANNTFLAGDLALLGTDGKAYSLTDPTLFDSYFANKPIAEVVKAPIRNGLGDCHGSAVLSNDNIAYIVNGGSGFYLTIYDKLGNTVLGNTWYPFPNEPSYNRPLYAVQNANNTITIHAMPDGKFIVTFLGYYNPYSGVGNWYARFFMILSNSGGVLVNPTQIGSTDTQSYSSNYPYPATVTVLTTGNIAITWQVYLSNTYLWTYVITPAGVTVGSSQQNISNPTWNQLTSCALTNGNYVVGFCTSGYGSTTIPIAAYFSSTGYFSSYIYTISLYQSTFGCSTGKADPGNNINGAYVNLTALTQGGFAISYGVSNAQAAPSFYMYTSDNTMTVTTNYAFEAGNAGAPTYNGIPSCLSPVADGGSQLSWTSGNASYTMKFDRYGNVVGSKNPIQASTYLNAIKSIDDSVYVRSYGSSGVEYVYKISAAGAIVGTYQDLSPSAANRLLVTSTNMLVLTNGLIQALLNTAVSSRVPIGVAQNDAEANNIVTIQVLGTSRTRLTFPKSYSMDFSRNTMPGQNMYIVGNRAVMHGLLPTTINKTQLN